MKYFVCLIFSIWFLFSCESTDELSALPNQELTLEVEEYYENDNPFEHRNYLNDDIHNKAASLGRLLFYDSRLSKNNSISCANCHKQRSGFADDSQFSAGLENFKTSRNSMALTNNLYQISHFWEGHSGKVEDHILNPISNHIEMGMRSPAELVSKLSEIDDYNRLFDEVYGQEINEEIIRISLGRFVSSIISYNSKFDQGKNINFANFSINELNGKEIFFGKAKCGECHSGDHYAATWRETANIGLDEEYDDPGAGAGNFKIPTLRNIALTSPYMHDGRFETLEEVVNHYTSGVQENLSLDWVLRNDIDLSEVEKRMLVDFLHTLTDYELINNEKFSNPFK